jgi:hypothetical protein
MRFWSEGVCTLCGAWVPSRRRMQGILTEREGFSTVDLLIKIGCLKEYSFNMKSNWFELFITRSSTVLILPPQ